MRENVVHVLSPWSLYALLIDQHKPVELQYFRNGQHNLTKPLEVLAHEEMLVDWFDFWLNGHEDSQSAEPEQYVRWRDMKNRLESSRAQPAADDLSTPH